MRGLRNMVVWEVWDCRGVGGLGCLGNVGMRTKLVNYDEL